MIWFPLFGIVNIYHLLVEDINSKKIGKLVRDGVLLEKHLGSVKLGNFSQLDIRFDKKWNKENISINLFVEILNLLAQKIPSPTEYGLERDDFGNISTPFNLVEVDVNRESIIPSFGFSIDF